MKKLLGMVVLVPFMTCGTANAYFVGHNCPGEWQNINNGVTSTSCSVSLSNTDGGTSYSFASSDLATGQLRASATALNGDTFSTSGLGSAILQDTITLSGSWTGDLLISMSMSVDGYFSGQYTPSQSMLGLLSLTTGLPFAMSTSRIDVAYTGTTPTVTNNYSSGSHTETVTNPTANSFSATLTADLLIPDTNPTFDIQAQLSTWAAPTGMHTSMTSNFANTANLSFTLPDGIDFTSDSGVFLSVNPVPVPAAVWLFGSGLLGFVGVSHRKRRPA
ncbi:MAG: VPLPA-CTERM sorting domain-containing protein [Candidatus Thiodiazotropha taylori]|nr:VPLPA-CTERM sorting domain-containing protein [Candidatus Thiodiazotropha taylori]MCW4242325.1 VPLPA-CTERM sorting domain-containing protein [Candidatus Thiodiazotropha taylori]